MTQSGAPVLERGRAKVEAKPAASGQYRVLPGDTLFKIAFEHGLDYRDLAAWNGLVDPGRIRAGDLLRVTPPRPTVTTRPLGAAAPAVETRPLAKPPVAATSPLPAAAPAASQAPIARMEERPAAKPVLVPASYAPSRPAQEPAAPPDEDALPNAWSWPARGALLGRYGEGLNKGIDIAGNRGAPVHAAASGRVVYAGSGLRGYGKLIIIRHGKTLLSAYAHNARIQVAEGQYVTRGQSIGEMGDSDTDRIKLHFEIREQGKPVDPLLYLPNAG